jgi:hypothetical protein
MMNSRKHSAQALRFAERRRREDEAPRLATEVPTLVSLQLDVEEHAGVAGGSSHTRRIVVERAPALFLVPCGDPRCGGDEHDLTSEVMRALRYGETSFHGEDECRGSLGMGACSRVLRFNAVARYQPTAP